MTPWTPLSSRPFFLSWPFWASAVLFPGHVTPILCYGSCAPAFSPSLLPSLRGTVLLAC